MPSSCPANLAADLREFIPKLGQVGIVVVPFHEDSAQQICSRFELVRRPQLQDYGFRIRKVVDTFTLFTPFAGLGIEALT